jgi:valyl-tRNA synthetase
MDHANLDNAFGLGRNFTNKIWNAGRFALMNIGEESLPAVSDVEKDLELADRWILSRYAAARDDVTRSLESFRFKEAAEATYHFFWGELADWYLELIKPRMLGDAGEASKRAAQATLVHVLDGVLRLLHPIMPFITEALWLRLPIAAGAAREESLVVGPWPAEGRSDADAEARMNALIELIGAVRTLRSENNVPAASTVRVQITNMPEVLADALQVEARALRRMARVEDVMVNGAPSGMGAHAVLRSGADVFLPLAGLIDVDQERQRLTKELDRITGQIRATETRLGSEQFAARAPAEIVAKEREKLSSLHDQAARLQSKLESLSS